MAYQSRVALSTIAVLLLTGFVSAQESTVLKVPYVKQTGPTCGLASFRMLMGYHGLKEEDPDKTWDRIRSHEGGTELYLMGRYCRRRGLSPKAFLPDSVDTLKTLVKLGQPVLVVIQENHTRFVSPTHAVVVIGFARRNGKEEVVVHDPAWKAERHIAVKTFDQSWLLGGPFCRLAFILRADKTKLKLPREKVGPLWCRMSYEVSTRNWQAATTECEKMITTDRTFVPGYLMLGSCYSQRRQPKKAEAAYAKAVEVNAKHCWGIPLLNLGALQLANRDPRPAIANLKRFLELSKQGPTALADYRKRATDAVKLAEVQVGTQKQDPKLQQRTYQLTESQKRQAYELLRRRRK